MAAGAAVGVLKNVVQDNALAGVDMRARVRRGCADGSIPTYGILVL